jgi:hypothetical protein
MSNHAFSKGGGMYNLYNSLNLQDSTVSANSAALEGGGIHVSNHDLSLTNCTVSGNSAGSHGGGMRAGGDTTVIENSTVVSNTAGITNGGGGLYEASSMVAITNTILAYNRDGDGSAPNCRGTVDSGDYNLVHDVPGCTLAGANNLTGVDPLLDPLADNGGDTQTHALQNASLAIDAGAADCTTTDQRGEARDDLGCDIGAFELIHSDSDTVVKDGLTNGTQASFGPAYISITVTSGDAGVVTATQRHTAPGGLADDPGEMSVTWYLTASGDTYSATLALCYTDAQVAGLDEAALWAYRWDGAGWVNMYGNPDPTNNCVTVADVNAFSAWTLYDYTAEGAPTAIRLLDLEARSAPLAGLGMLVLLAAGACYLTFRRHRMI